MVPAKTPSTDWNKLISQSIVRSYPGRSYWLEGEERGLTPWIREHLDEVGARLDLNLQFVGFEVPVGAFRVDISARDDAGRTVLIENQFGPSDHKHLGKILTYAAVAAPEVVVWIAASSGPNIGAPIRKEHCRTLKYYNELLVGRTALCAIGVDLESDPDSFDPVPRIRLALRPPEYPLSRNGAKAQYP